MRSASGHRLKSYRNFWYSPDSVLLHNRHIRFGYDSQGREFVIR
jgi:hypothetical protein